jgi:hypothetical protein
MTGTYVCGACGPLDLTTSAEIDAHHDMHREISLAESSLRGLSGASLGWWWLSFCDTDRPTGTQTHREIGAVYGPFVERDGE